MSDKETASRDDGMAEIHQAIGEFVVSFEKICFAMETGISFILNAEGLRNQRVGDVILAGMTADPLASLYAAIVAETQDLVPDDQKIVDNALKRFQKLTSIRNDIVHGMWFIGNGNDQTTDWSNTTTRKLHKNKKGVVYKSNEWNPASIGECTTEAKELVALFLFFVGRFAMTDTPRSLSQYVDIEPDGTASVKPQHRGSL